VHYFQKDPANDGYGRGVHVHTIESLKIEWKVNDATIAEKSKLEARCKAISKQMVRDKQDLLVQRGVDPLLLSGSRKFDFRLYVAVTDRAPYAAYLHWAYLRFSVLCSGFDPFLFALEEGH
jgi:hypothetical protein